MTDKQIIFKCDVDCIRKNTEECFELDCIKGQESILKQLKAKEQECEELKKIIDEAKNSKLDLKSFLVGEAVQNEYEQQLDQLKEQLEAYKMEAEEGKEINSELKAENEGLKIYIESNEQQVKEVEKLVMDNDRLINELNQLKQTLTEIKEIMKKHCRKCKKHKFYHFQLCCTCKYTDILEKISEVEDE